ncbi:MAG TPA: pilin [Candidatus Saccharimonadales bacterium]|nr:pilin [Candidatus Saccharimonadales bacterium]
MKRLMLTIFTSLALIMAPAAMVPAYAACSGSTAKDQVLKGIGQTSGDCSAGEDAINHTVHTIVNILSYIVGIVSIVAIISAGFKYITSGGESSKISNAKSTIIYALVGLVIAVLAQMIIYFVINEGNSAAHNCGQKQHYDDQSKSCVTDTSTGGGGGGGGSNPHTTGGGTDTGGTDNPDDPNGGSTD